MFTFESEQQFESFCLAVFTQWRGYAGLEKYGRRGQEQFGLALNSNSPYWRPSCCSMQELRVRNRSFTNHSFWRYSRGQDGKAANRSHGHCGCCQIG
jgi:hypothetical protein